MLALYPQAATAPDTIQLWIGLYDDPAPQPPQVAVAQAPGAVVQVVSPLAPIRDDIRDEAGRPLNHRTLVRIGGLAPGGTYNVTVTAGAEQKTLGTATLPARLPSLEEGAFNIFLCSCYYQPEDASGTLSNVISKILMRPHLSLMLGDQIYGDLPLDVDWPGGHSMARILGEKYMRNFASRALETGGLAKVLQRAPAVCVADDHEFWNNYPFRQAQLPNTWTQGQRDKWKAAALALYEDYQLGGERRPGLGWRLDIDPLKILVMDTRCERAADFSALLSPQGTAQFKAWAADLRAARRKGQPAFGLLSSGQALFAKATEVSRRESQDAELGNWTQFDDLIVPTFEALAEEGIPVVYVTGDVHWGRVSRAMSPLVDAQPMIHEVICSPSTLIRVPALDSAKTWINKGKGIFGKAERWPRHSQPEEVPDRLGQSTRFRLECKLGKERPGPGFHRQGDQVAMLSLWRAGGGVDFRVTYFEVSPESSGANPESTALYSMRNL